LKINYNIYALDLPSHKNSDNFQDLSLNLYSDVLKAFIDYLKVEKVILAGHSLGGAVIQDFYFKYPNDVSILILIGTGGRLRVHPFILNIVKTDYQQFLISMSDSFYSKTPKEIIKKCIDETSNIPPQVTHSDFRICDEFDTLHKTNTITIPCLILCGTDDKMTPPKYSQFFHDKLKNSQLKIIEKAGHMVMVEQPKQVNKAIENFINSLKKSQ
jgi:pimeloyl-ACP methyl ester carboxylesterase